MSKFTTTTGAAAPKHIDLPTNIRFRIATNLVNAGFSVVPIRADGSKAPACSSWVDLQHRLPTADELAAWFPDGRAAGLAAICGKTSGNLETIDFDYHAEQTFPEWREIVESHFGSLADCTRIHVSKTPKGYHVRYRCVETIPGNLKLAQVVVDGKRETLIETRGEGGYALCPGSAPECNTLLKDYHDLSAFGLHKLEGSLSADERETLINAARSLGQHAEEHREPATPTSAKFTTTTGPTYAAGDSPGADYCKRGPTWAEILEPHGWRLFRNKSDGSGEWTRPGKDKGCSATTGHCSNEASGELFYPFSSNAAPFESGRAYNKFAVYTLLNHGGDFGKAARALADLGYGHQAGPQPIKAKPATIGQDGQNSDLIILASSIEPKEVRWLWPGRIPLGKLTTFAGNGGLGKTFVSMDIAARVTTGAEWPDGIASSGAGRVLYISGEDDPSDTLVPRLIACSADLQRIAFFTAFAQGEYSLANMQMLETACVQLGDDLKLVVIDPPTSYLAGTNDHKNAELRQLLTPLATWAAERGVAVVFISHVSKPQGAKVEAVMRVLGSVAWINAVRAAHMFVADPDDPDKRLFIGMKQNLSKRKNGLRYEIVSVDPEKEYGPAKVVWHGEVDWTADEALNSSPSENKRESSKETAREFIIAKLRESNTWNSSVLEEACKKEGISRSAMFAAKKELGIPAKQVYLAGARVWVWEVPEGWQPPPPPDTKAKKKESKPVESQSIGQSIDQYPEDDTLIL